MIDLILILFVICVFFGGFWCGKTFGTWALMVERISTKVSTWKS